VGKFPWTTVLCGAAGLFLVLSCLLPALEGVWNLGSLTGVVLGLFLLLQALLSFSVPKVLQIVLLIIFALAAGETAVMIHADQKKPQGDENLVVLGCQVHADGTLSEALRERMDKAYAYLAEHPQAKAVLTGGQGADEPLPEAQAMAAYLVDKGIPEERLYLDETSGNTWENLAHAKDILEAENLGGNIAVVTSETHMARALYAAEKMGLKAAALPASTRWDLFMPMYIRELYGLLYAWLSY
jgi:uncharacterized SAM-binding protein YcdF (DUF218 family)